MTTMTAPKLPKMKTVLGWKVLHLYVDPHPGLDNSDEVPGPCKRCGGRKIFEGYRHIQDGVCFECDGSGQSFYKVSTMRGYAKSDALIAEYGDELQAYWDEVEAKAEATRLVNEFAAHWDEAHAEAAKRAAMVGGFVAEVGTNIKGMGLVGEIKFEKIYDTGFGYHKTIGKFMIIELTDGKIIKIMGTGNGLFGVSRGDKVAIVGGSVKEHDNYGGQDQTVLQRARLERIESDDEEDQ